MTDMDESTFEADLVEEDAARDIAKAVSARHSIARKYVMRVRRRNPDATPAEVIRLLERHTSPPSAPRVPSSPPAR